MALCGLSLKQSRKALQGYFHRFLKRSGLWQFVHTALKDQGLYTFIEFCNGSTLDVMTVEQGEEMHQGARRSLVIYDEEPTRAVFEEGLFRFKSGMQSRIVFTMTPTQGKSWVWEHLMQQSVEKGVGLVHATVFENGRFRCARCLRWDAEAAADEGRKVRACDCAVPRWEAPPCPACGRTRAEWDARLGAQGVVREPERNAQTARDWLQTQIRASVDVAVTNQACGRCWTYGVWPRADAKEIRNKLLHVRDPKRIAMRFCGWWEELDGQSCLSSAQILALKRYCQKPSAVEGPVRIWERPIPGHPYTLGVDMAHGTGGDEIAMQALDASTGHQVALWADNEIPWAQSLPDCVGLAEEYEALVVPETASTGSGLIEHLKQFPHLRLYHYRSPDRHVRTIMSEKIGFNPGPRNADRIRHHLILALVAGMRELPDGTWEVVPGSPDACYVRDGETVEQLRRLFYDEAREGRIQKPPGTLDDRVDALALAWEGRCHPDECARTARTIVKPADDEGLWRQYARQIRRYGVT